KNDYEFKFDLPTTLRAGGRVRFDIVATDRSNNSTTKSVELPVDNNLAPVLDIKRFKSRREITSPERLNYGEFWVRTGSTIEIDALLSDDAEISTFTIYRLTSDGEKIEVYGAMYNTQCPEEQISSKLEEASFIFDQVEATFYQIELVDNTDQATIKEIVVHPVDNVTPGIRFTTPVDNDEILAGSFRFKVAAVAADDAALAFENVEFLVNGLQVNASYNFEAANQMAETRFENALNEIYDEFEENYGENIADDFARKESDFVKKFGWTLELPTSLINADEEFILTVRITDADNAIGTDEITVIGIQDRDAPESILVNPVVGFGAVESSNFTAEFRAFDNVKVNQLELYVSYGVMDNSGSYVRLDYGLPVRNITSIPARDFNVVDTENIDTPLYQQLINVPKYSDLIDMFAGTSLDGEETFDVWLRVVSRDAANGEGSHEQSFPINIDERPVIDIVEPANGESVVESTIMAVQVQAFDDVGIQSVRLIATHGSQSVEIANQRLTAAPYTFAINVPQFDLDNAANNIINISVEAIDTYGATHGELDKHTATESINLTIKQDEAPVVAIGLPVNNSEKTEGEKVLVQVNAIDDVGIENVVLSVNGLISGNKSYSDNRAPYEFLIDIPYGQAGTDVLLSATATEVRLSGEPREVSTLSDTRLIILEDLEAPTITILKPEDENTVVVEKRVLPYAIDVTDNVSVHKVTAILSVQDRVVSSMNLLAPPYTSVFTLGTIEDYYEGDASSINELALQFTVEASDGVGNLSRTSVPVLMKRNSPPEVKNLQVLDRKGNYLGDVSEITEGREFVVNVIASDVEVGVDRIKLYRAINPSSDEDYELIGEDAAVPFEFHTESGHRVGETLSFKAIAIDQDGYESDLSTALDLEIVKDLPPEAKIVKPNSDESVIIDGQQLEIFVEAKDDLGPEGIDRVVFYVNNTPVQTAFESYTEVAGVYAQETIYRAVVLPPEGVDGFVLQATVFDVLGQSTQTQVVRVGRIDDTVKPVLSVLNPLEQSILTTGETITPAVSIEDIGSESDRQVIQVWTREYQDALGNWITLSQREIELFRDDVNSGARGLPQSDPDNHYYIYWADFSDGNILRRGDGINERVKVVTSVNTPNHTAEQITIHEVGLPLAESRFLLPKDLEGEEPLVQERILETTKEIFYTAVEQYQSETKDGALVAAWSTVAPSKAELKTSSFASYADLGDIDQVPWTGVFLADAVDETESTVEGERLIYSSVLNGAAEVFKGTITEIHADDAFIMAGKSGQIGCVRDCDVVEDYAKFVQEEIAKFSETGKFYPENEEGELIIFNTVNADENFGIPYTKVGRVDLPYKDVYGLDRKDNLALVANGYGGVQVIDISDLSSPYHVGYIKPNGFARDVKVIGHFAFIAASYEGLVIADLREPSLPIIAKLDTSGVANRLQVVGDLVYLTNMSGDSELALLDVINVADPYTPQLQRSIDLKTNRPDHVTDGAYDLSIVGNLALVTTLTSDQEDKPAQSILEIVDLNNTNQGLEDYTVPAVLNAATSEDVPGARGVIAARGKIQIAGVDKGIQSV
ncbi:MAG: Ig-like domain-containing protein, partial [Kangiellaceae bacterium]|nr:Ig-like domain-containing protein [Kangiellaceae bacterium]